MTVKIMSVSLYLIILSHIYELVSQSFNVIIMIYQNVFFCG